MSDTPVAPPRTNMMALIGFIAAFVVPVAAIPLCIIGRRQIAMTHEEGHGLATAGLAIGIAFTALGVVFFLVWLSLFSAALAQSPLG